MGSEDELIRLLAAGRLPPFTLVWREGWGEWLPAMQVEELSEAFPVVGPVGVRAARPSMIPGVPPVPVSEYPRLRHLAKEAPLGWPDGFEGPAEEVITSEVPADALREAARAMTQPTPPRDLGLQQAVERASRLPGKLTPFFEHDDDRTPVSRPALPLAMEFGLQGLIDEAPPKTGRPWLRAYGLWIALAAIAFGLCATFALRWFGVLRRVPAPASAPARSAGLTPPPPPPLGIWIGGASGGSAGASASTGHTPA